MCTDIYSRKGPFARKAESLEVATVQPHDVAKWKPRAFLEHPRSGRRGTRFFVQKDPCGSKSVYTLFAPDTPNFRRTRAVRSGRWRTLDLPDGLARGVGDGRPGAPIFRRTYTHP